MMKVLMLKRILILLAVLSLCVACSGGDGITDGGLDAPQLDGDGGEDADLDADGGTDGGEDGSADADAGPVPLSLHAVLPSRGPVAGGTWANIIGGGFVDGVGESAFDVRDVTAVRFCDNSAIDIEVIRDDMISVRTPSGLPGACPVTVENPRGSVILESAFTFFETVAAYSANPPDLFTEGGEIL